MSRAKLQSLARLVERKYQYVFGFAHRSTDILRSSTYTPRHAEEIGWRPNHRPEHILEDAVVDGEVDAILSLMDDSLRKVR